MATVLKGITSQGNMTDYLQTLFSNILFNLLLGYDQSSVAAAHSPLVQTPFPHGNPYKHTT